LAKAEKKHARFRWGPSANVENVVETSHVFQIPKTNMFDQIANQLTGSSPIPNPEIGSKEALESITRRLQQEVPQGVYLKDSWLAKVLGISHKTLINRRRAKPGTLPNPLQIAGVQSRLHPRDDLVAWLARQEWKARTRTVHRCM
jgi:hypothetical protein